MMVLNRDRTLLQNIAMVAILFGLLTMQARAESPKHVAIANFGPHPVLTDIINGFKDGMKQSGFVAPATVVYDYSDANFDPALLPQVLTKLDAAAPDLMLTVTTPVTQASVKLVHDKNLPIVFAPVTDPVQAGLVPDWNHGSPRYVGASNLQDMDALIAFARGILPKVTSFGLIYNPGDANDVVNRDAAEVAAKAAGLGFKSISVDSVNDIGPRTMSLAGVDFIYAMPSSMIQPALPAMAAAADRMKIPVISASTTGVKDNSVLAAYAVDQYKVGYQAGLMAARILKGAKPSEIANYRPTAADDSPLLNGRRMKEMGLTLPASLAGCNCVVN
jgi:putative tryptophan/tyrosine transport system substrate-binding protein